MLDLGVGAIYSPGSGGLSAVGAIALQPSVSATYSFTRYFQAGLAALGHFVTSEDLNVWSGSFLFVVGIPNSGPDHYPQRDFYKSP